jgi:hypothetical protein
MNPFESMTTVLRGEAPPLPFEERSTGLVHRIGDVTKAKEEAKRRSYLPPEQLAKPRPTKKAKPAARNHVYSHECPFDEGRKRKYAIPKPGDRYGRFTVLCYDGATSAQCKYFLCRCDCGTVKAVRAANLQRNQTISCGCARSEAARATMTARNKAKAKKEAQ